jgi:hypothetical protein
VWKQYFKLYFFFFLVSACTNKEKENFQRVQISISERNELQLGYVGLSSSLPFPAFTFERNSNNLILNNSIGRSLDTISFENQQGSFSRGKQYDIEGPNILPSSLNIFYSEKGLHFLQKKQIITWINGDQKFQNIIEFNRFPEFKDIPFWDFGGGYDFEWGYSNKAYDPKNELFYVLGQNLVSGEYAFGMIDLLTREYKSLPLFFDTSLVKKYEVKYFGEAIFHINNLPYFLVEEGRIIFSYIYSNDIEVLNLSNKAVKKIDFETSLFKNEKDVPLKLPSEMTTMQAFDLTTNWDSDVAYGRLKELPNKLGYFRLIKGNSKVKGGKGEEIFLEVFDKKFDKLNELNLSDFQPDIGRFYFVFDGGIFIKSKDQPNEDVLNYYVLNINF